MVDGTGGGETYQGTGGISWLEKVRWDSGHGGGGGDVAWRVPVCQVHCPLSRHCKFNECLVLLVFVAQAAATARPQSRLDRGARRTAAAPSVIQ